MTKAEMGAEILKAIARKKDAGYRLSAARIEDIVRDLCEVEGKMCDCCEEWVPLAGFYCSTGGKFGRRRLCKACDGDSVKISKALLRKSTRFQQ